MYWGATNGDAKEKKIHFRQHTFSLEQSQGASHVLKPHCAPVGSLPAQYITGRQNSAEE